MPDYDAVVLGAGPAGVRVAGALARAGRTVALIEHDRADGGDSACLARMATKSLLLSARRGETWERAVARRDAPAQEAGAELRAPVPRNAAEAADGLADERRGDNGAAGDNVTRDRVTGDSVTGHGPGDRVAVLRGPGRVVRPGAVDVAGAEHGYTDLVVCTGSEPVRPALPGLADVPAWTVDEALGRADLPRRLVVLGGGPVGCELAQIYAAFGSRVTVVDAADRLLATEAPFIGAAIGDALRRLGVDLRLGVRPDRAEPAQTGFRLRLREGGAIEADRMLLTAERSRPRVADLGLEALGVDPTAGLSADPTGRIAQHLWAVGDVTAGPPGAHAAGYAAYQADVVAANILGGRREADYRAIPRAVYTTPSGYAVGVAPTGVSDQDGDHDGDPSDELVAAGVDLCEIARAGLPGDARGRVELYADRSRGVLVGAAALGPHAEEWMGEVALAIRAEIPLSTLADVVRASPTYGEAIGIAARELVGRLGTASGRFQERRENLMSEQDSEPVGVETPEDDAKEQNTPVRQDDEQREWMIQVPFDANEADATEQERLVELDEDDYR